MGARINYVFNEGDEKPAVWLYSHWGETDWEESIATAIWMAKPRWQDTSYAIRIIISQLINDQWDSETGFGIGAVSKPSEFMAWDTTVEIDMVNQQIDGHSFEEFCAYHLGASNLENIGFRVPISS